MTAVDVLGRLDELTDGTGGSVDAVMGAAMESISEIPARTQMKGRDHMDSASLVGARRLPSLSETTTQTVGPSPQP